MCGRGNHKSRWKSGAPRPTSTRRRASFINSSKRLGSSDCHLTVTRQGPLPGGIGYTKNRDSPGARYPKYQQTIILLVEFEMQIIAPGPPLAMFVRQTNWMEGPEFFSSKAPEISSAKNVAQTTPTIRRDFKEREP